MRLFAFHPPLVGAELQHEHGSQFFVSGFYKAADLLLL
jgi:hypothetical protein